jgi:hypothetical protein
MDTTVWADSSDEAIEKAIRQTYRPGAMFGLIIGVEAEGEEEVIYGTEAFLLKFRAKLGPIPEPSDDAPPEVLLEWGLRETGMTETQLTHSFISHLIDEDKNPFLGMPNHLVEEVRRKYPDLVERAHAKFGVPPAKAVVEVLVSVEASVGAQDRGAEDHGQG